MWSNEDRVFLKKNYQELSDQELSEILGKTVNAIQKKRSKLGYNRKALVPAVYIHRWVARMKELIKRCEDPNIKPPLKDKYKAELLELSERRQISRKPVP